MKKALAIFLSLIFIAAAILAASKIIAPEKKGGPDERKKTETKTEAGMKKETEAKKETTRVLAKNSTDADGFLWGTEAGLSDESEFSEAINDFLQTKFVKVRLSVQKGRDGKFSPVLCLPSRVVCLREIDWDENVQTAKENGWSLMPMISMGADANEDGISESDIADYVDFTEWFIDRYGKDADIRYLELVNYPGQKQNWNGTDEQLVDLQNRVYERIKEKYPDIQVGTPGFEYWHDESGEGAAVSQIEFFLDKKNGAKFDFWAVHNYPTRTKTETYPPTKNPLRNRYAGINGLAKIRQIMDANGWQERRIMNTEFVINQPGVPVKKELLEYEAAFTLQQLILEKTLKLEGKNVLAGSWPLKIRKRSEMLEGAFGSLNGDGSVSDIVRSAAVLWSKLDGYKHVSRLSGVFDDEDQVWVEKFRSEEGKELLVFFKPFNFEKVQAKKVDGETVEKIIDLGRKPKSAKLIFSDGKEQIISPEQSIILKAVNIPKYLELEY